MKRIATFKTRLLTLALCGFAMLTLSPKVEAAGFPDSSNPPLFDELPLFTNIVATVGVSNTTTSAARKIVVPQTGGLALYLTVSCVATQASTSNVVVKLRGSQDGVRWTTTFPYSATVTLSGTTTNIAAATAIATNIPYRYLALDGFTSTEVANSYVDRVQYLFAPATAR